MSKLKYKLKTNLTDIANDIDNISEESKEKIKTLEIEPSIENLDSAIEQINTDNLLSNSAKDELIEVIKIQYIELFNFDNCPIDYYELKKQARFLSGMTQYSFLLMAQRLMKIRDGELYKIDGYNNFKEFVEKEMNISRRSAYDYISIVDCFGVRALAQFREVEYSKLLPVIPIIKAKNQQIPKDKLKQQFLDDIEKKSYRDFQNDAKDLKLHYGLVKLQDSSDPVTRLFTNFVKSLPKEITDTQKDQVRNVIAELQKLI